MNDDLIIKYIETTGKCNYSCPICIPKIRNYNFNMKEFQTIIDCNLDLFYKKAIWLDLNGEPLMDPDFFEKVKYMHSKGINTRMSTNGSLLNKENRKKLLESKISYVVVSIGTLDKDVYKKIRGIDNLSNVLNNLIELKKSADRINSKIELQAVMIDAGESDEKKEEFIKYFHSMGINVAFHKFTNRAKNVKLDIQPKYKRDDKIVRGECKGLKSNLIILSNCEVITCCCDYMAQNSLGNLRDYDYSVRKLMKNGKLEQIISDLRNHRYNGACKNCSDWIYYQEGATEEYVTVYPFINKK